MTGLWARIGVGIVAIAIGLVWIAQGLKILGGSPMSGHPVFSVLGLVVVVAGAVLLWSTSRATSRAR